MKSNLECLIVLDARTAKSYKIPIQDNHILGADVAKIVCPDNNGDEGSIERPLRILDRGYENTACMESSITVMYAICSPPGRLHCNLVIGMGNEARSDSGIFP